MTYEGARVTGGTMSNIDALPIYDDLVELLAESTDPNRLLSFRLSTEKQERLDALLEKNRLGLLTDTESAELDAYEHLEHLVRLIKARLIQKRGR
jgi:hypothetical protein